MNVQASQRYTRQRPCPICNGHGGIQPGRGERCTGYYSHDGEAAFCSQVESDTQSAGAGSAHAPYVHRLNGECSCGQTHGYALTTNAPRRKVTATPEPEAVDANTLDRLYQRILELSPLRPEHMKYLGDRGASDLQAAQRFGYGSLPRKGQEVTQLVEQLTTEYGERVLERSPGFYREHGQLTFHAADDHYDAIIVPNREHGQITSFTRMQTTGDRGKYMTAASGGQPYAMAGQYRPVGRRQLIVVDGLHKAYTCSILDEGDLWLGLSGMALSEEALDAIRRAAPDVVSESFDSREKPEAADAAKKLHQQLREAGIPVEQATWNTSTGKGPDDVLKAGGELRFRPVATEAASTDAHAEQRIRDLESFIAAETQLFHARNLTPGEKLFLRSVARIEMDGEREPDLRTLAMEAGACTKTASSNSAVFEKAGLVEMVPVETSITFTTRNRSTGELEERNADKNTYRIVGDPIAVLRAAPLRCERTKRMPGRPPPTCPDDETHPVREVHTIERYCAVDGQKLGEPTVIERTFTPTPGNVFLPSTSYRRKTFTQRGYEQRKALQLACKLSEPRQKEIFGLRPEDAGKHFREDDDEENLYCPRCSSRRMVLRGNEWWCGKCNAPAQLSQREGRRVLEGLWVAEDAAAGNVFREAAAVRGAGESLDEVAF
jgi:hypothetical protein